VSRQIANRNAIKRRRLGAGAVGATGLTATGVAGWALQRRHLRRIAADPENALLTSPPAGRPLRVEAIDGTALHAEAFGPEDAPTIVLAHGWTEALRFWIYQIDDLSKEFRVIAYDLRGHGCSEPARGGDYSLARFGDDLESVLAACVPDGQRAIVAGHSLGAMSIVAWAERHDVPLRASAAALLNTGLGGLIGESLLIRVPGLVGEHLARRGFLGNKAPIPRFSSPVSSAIVRYASYAPGASLAAIAFYERMLLDCKPDIRAVVGLAMADMELHHAVEKLTVPTLVLAGAADRLTPPSHAQRIAALLPNLHSLVELPDTGHMAALERPHVVSAQLRELAGTSMQTPREETAFGASPLPGGEQALA
jgi:pimeloyl-ACP methyl ester carboxylesterase